MDGKNIDNLANRVFITRDARFAASRRMSRNKIASKAAEAFLSASIICVSLISLQIDNVELSKVISGLTIVLSTFLLVLSLLFSLLDYGKRYDNYNKCGLELSRLYHEIECLKNSKNGVDEEPDGVSSLSDEYENILLKYNLNHTTFDKDYSLLFNDNVTTSHFKWIWLNVRYYIFDVYLLYWIIAVGPIVTILWYYLSKLF